MYAANIPANDGCHHIAFLIPLQLWLFEPSELETTLLKPATIIPVIDLMGGQVVKAVGGDRAQYAPIRTPLSPNASPVEVAKGFLTLAPFKRLYLADLDALAGHPPQFATINAITQTFPNIELWVDTGIATEEDYHALTTKINAHLVVGSETLRDLSLPKRLNCILSLDFQGDTFLGDPNLLKNTYLWPQEIIIMTLERVGSAGRPAFERLKAFMARAGKKHIYAAGGVRNTDDLYVLASLGIAGALVATALHSGTITP